jgi:hypothetical protein
MAWAKQETNIVVADLTNISILVYFSDAASNPPNAERVRITIAYDDGSVDSKDGLLEEFFQDPIQAATVKSMLEVVKAEYLLSLGYSSI